MLILKLKYNKNI